MTLADEGRRLALAAALTRAAGSETAEEADEDALVARAQALAAGADELGRRRGVRFEPAYPGATVGPERTPSGLRLVLACRVLDEDGPAIGTAFTILIPGRRPLVSVGPPAAAVPSGWRPLRS